MGAPGISRVIIIVLDGVGVGALPDAAGYGDLGSNTLGNTADAVGGLDLPNLAALGLGNIGRFRGVPRLPRPAGSWGKMAEVSPGKDTTTGHWEMAGIRLDRPFPVYPEGFPPEVIGPFAEAIGTGVLGNKTASGTGIIRELGAEHMRTGRPIVYTSVDSVFQVAAHKEVIPLDRLYGICRAARAILTGRHAVGRVIARPFTGEPGRFVRTHERRDFSVEPPGETLLDIAKGRGFPVVGIGKTGDIFAGRGLTASVHTKGNDDGVSKTLDAMRGVCDGIIFTNLVEFDMMYGHRNDPRGFARALGEFDARLPEITGAMGVRDLLMITGDHGCDPTTASTDHSREYAPLLVYGPGVRGGADLGVRESFSDIGRTAAEALGLELAHGRSFLGELV